MTDMRLIYDLEYLEGLTIEKALYLSDGIALIFTDNSYCVIDLYNERFYDDEELIDNETLRDIGIITKEEYKKRKDEECQYAIDIDEALEKAEYERLKAKYEDQ